MAKSTYINHFDDMLKAIDVCISLELILPSLVLIYSGIDIAGWLATVDSEFKVRDRFIKWTDKYIQPEENVGCTSIELYSARCAILHSFTADSNLSDRGIAKRIAYAWGQVDLAPLIRSIEFSGKSDITGVQLTDLYRSFRSGLEYFFVDVENDSILQENVNIKAARAFSNLSKVEFESLLDRLNGT